MGHRTISGSYDNIVISLTESKELRKTSTANTFQVPKVSVSKNISPMKIHHQADVSGLRVSRTLCFNPELSLYSYNVDSEGVKRSELAKHVSLTPPYAGIDTGIKTIYVNRTSMKGHSLNEDDTITLRSSIPGITLLNALLPSSSNPKDTADMVFKYNDNSIYKEESIIVQAPTTCESNFDAVRLVRDVSLVCNWRIKKWVVCRITMS